MVRDKVAKIRPNAALPWKSLRASPTSDGAQSLDVDPHGVRPLDSEFPTLREATWRNLWEASASTSASLLLLRVSAVQLSSHTYSETSEIFEAQEYPGRSSQATI